MDNMALSWELPAEDEIATPALTGGISPYSAIVLPREYEAQLRQFFTFARGEASGSCRESQIETSGYLDSHFLEWKRCFLHFMKKVTLSLVLNPMCQG